MFLQKVSRERVQRELEKILVDRDPLRCFRYFFQNGL